jgi:hypothetical protein
MIFTVRFIKNEEVKKFQARNYAPQGDCLELFSDRYYHELTALINLRQVQYIEIEQEEGETHEIEST